MSMELLKKHRFAGILRHIPPECALQTAQAMYEGGVRIFEITFDPSAADTARETAGVIHSLRSAFREDVSVGAGTVLNLDFARAALEAGAEFLVSPCTDPEVIAFAKQNGLLAIPGAYTPTEIVNAHRLGADLVKIFPILPNGIDYLKNVVSPLSHIPFMVTGGVNPDTVEAFLAAGATALGAGATIVTKEMALRGEYTAVRENARRHVEKIR